MLERPLRVLLIVNWATHEGGAEVQLLHLARGLAANGHAVTLCCVFRSDLDESALEGTGIELVQLGVTSRKGRPFAIPRMARMARRADVVQCTMWDPSLWGRLAAILARRPVVVADHATDRSVQVASSGQSRAAWIARHNRLLDPFTYATVACASSQRAVLESEGVSAEKIVHIPNGIPIDSVLERARGGLAREDLGLRSDAPLVVQVAAFREEKNQLGTLEIVRGARERVPGTQLAYVGEGIMEDAVRRRVAEIGAEEWVRFLGFRRDATAIMGLADLHLLPSRSDAMPMTVIESMALGVPTIASDVGDVSRVLGDAGICLPPGDTEAFTSACAALLGDARERERLGEIGRRRVRDYDSSAMVGRYERLFRGAVDGTPPRRAVPVD